MEEAEILPHFSGTVCMIAGVLIGNSTKLHTSFAVPIYCGN